MHGNRKVPSEGNFYFEWSEWSELNRRPLAPEASALPSCATFRAPIFYIQNRCNFNEYVFFDFVF